ncbi:MAG: heme exporter protein CcmD [Bosea sp.]|jgi:heme exporter protein D|nr:heme exporter protein CcmD [Bosea sp. (in: a-proteobacteria)]
MSALGPHAAFIIFSYVAAIAVLGGLTAYTWADNRARRRELAALDPGGAGKDRS